MSIHQIWTFFQEAKAAGISGEKLAEVRKVDDQGGVKTGAVSYWQRKLLGMYSENAKLSLLKITLHVLLMAASTPVKSSWSLCFIPTSTKWDAWG